MAFVSVAGEAADTPPHLQERHVGGMPHEHRWELGCVSPKTHASIVPTGFEHGTAAIIQALCDELEEGGGQAAADVPGLLAKVVPRCRAAVAADDPPSKL